jgi:hypothetical protein
MPELALFTGATFPSKYGVIVPFLKLEEASCIRRRPRLGNLAQLAF